MNPLKIIIISGTIYPHLSPRSFRATELAIGFAKKGHDVTIYSILGRYEYANFEREHNVKVKDMGKSYFGNIDSDGEYRSRTFFNRVMGRLLYNVIDYPRIEYFFKTIKTLKREYKFDYLITIAHPYPIHFGTAFYKKYINKSLFKVWTSDCGDPYIRSYNSKRLKIFLQPLEKLWGKQTDYIAIPVESSIIGYFKEFRDKIQIIPQGIDFDKVILNKYVENEIPTFLYAGVVYQGKRDPSMFLEYLCKLDFNFKFIIYTINPSFYKKHKEKLGDKLELRTYIPREELIKILSTMDFLINITNNSGLQQPSKLIDYGLSKRPIIDISTNFDEQQKRIFSEFLAKDYTSRKIIEDLSRFNISNVCNQFVDLFKLKVR